MSGSGDLIIAPKDPLPIQFQKEVRRMHEKWPNVTKYIVYFQNFTNTHAPVDVIRHRFEQVLGEKKCRRYLYRDAARLFTVMTSSTI